MDPEVIRWIIQAVIILILSICVHEFGHAIVAYKLGDGTPKVQGRVTLNPVSHADPIGTVGFPLLALIMTKGASMGFGWGRPVMIQPINFTRKLRMRVSHMLVALAGPAMNVLLALVISTVHVILLKQGVIDKAETSGRGIPLNLSAALHYAATINLVLFFFNLIPAHPLDGGAVLEGLLPEKALKSYQTVKVYGPFILMAVIFIPQLSRLFVGPAYWIYGQWSGLIGLS